MRWWQKKYLKMWKSFETHVRNIECRIRMWDHPRRSYVKSVGMWMRMKTSGCASLTWFNSTTEKKTRDALPKMWKVLRRCFLQWNENIPKIMKICFHALIASEKHISFICTAISNYECKEISTLQMQKRQNQSHVEDEYERELAEHAGGMFQWVWRYSKVKLLIWAGYYYSRGTWYRGKINTD